VWAGVAARLGWTSAVHLGARLAGGLRLAPTRLAPTRLRHEDRGVAVEVSWDGVTGVVREQLVPLLLRADPPGRAQPG
jgi:hypothetical protein